MEQWRDFAECRGMDPDLFHPFDGDAEAEAEAKATCATCPAREACLDYGLAHARTDGIYGGLTARERRALARTRQRAAVKVRAS